MDTGENKQDFTQEEFLREGQSTAQLVDTTSKSIQKKKFTKPVSQKKKRGCLTVIIIFFVLGIIGSLFGNGDEESQSNKQDVEVTNTIKPKKAEEQNKDTKQGSKKKNDTKAWEKKYKNKDIKLVDIKFLYKNAEYYKNVVVMSYGKIKDMSDKMLQFDTNKDNFFKEVTCNFTNQEEISGLKKEDKVCFVGEISDTHSYFGTETLTIDNCYLVAKGKDVSSYKDKIDKDKKNQKQYISEIKKEQKEEKKKQIQDEKSTYIAKCKTYDYKTIQRKPDKYDGKKIKVSGTVIQVLEGWFDSVGLRVEDSNGDIWYINYSYSDGEDKILEDDNITVYGECTGTETYTTVLGSSVTIPSIDAEYIN